MCKVYANFKQSIVCKFSEFFYKMIYEISIIILSFVRLYIPLFIKPYPHDLLKTKQIVRIHKQTRKWGKLL